jgi:hypothetical protein
MSIGRGFRVRVVAIVLAALLAIPAWGHATAASPLRGSATAGAWNQLSLDLHEGLAWLLARVGWGEVKAATPRHQPGVSWRARGLESGRPGTRASGASAGQLQTIDSTGATGDLFPTTDPDG